MSLLRYVLQSLQEESDHLLVMQASQAHEPNKSKIAASDSVASRTRASAPSYQVSANRTLTPAVLVISDMTTIEDFAKHVAQVLPGNLGLALNVVDQDVATCGKIPSVEGIPAIETKPRS